MYTCRPEAYRAETFSASHSFLSSKGYAETLSLFVERFTQRPIRQSFAKPLLPHFAPPTGTNA
jgi:hypothetical protein